MANYWHFSSAQNVAFMVLKTTCMISRFQRKNQFEKWCNMTQDIYKIVFDFVSQTKPSDKTDFNHYLRQYWVVLQIFALKPWDYIIKATFWAIEKFKKLIIYLKNGEIKSDFAEKSELMVQNGLKML